MRAFVLVSSLVALTWSASATAAPTARLVYGRAAGAEMCPDESVVRKAVSERIGYDPFFPYATRTVVLTLSGKGPALTARVELVENEQANARELTTSEAPCEELLQSAALAIAIAIDPRALVAPVAGAATEAPPEPRPRPPVPEPPTADPAAEARTEEGRRPQVSKGRGPRARRIMLGPRAATGSQPGIAAGLGAGGAVLWDRFSLGAEVEAYLPTEADGEAGARARAWLIDGALIPCVHWRPVRLCGVAKAGRFEATGERVRDPGSDTMLFLGLGGRAGVELALSQAVDVEVTGDIVGNLARPDVKVGPTTLWRASPVSGVMAVSTSYRF